MNGVAGRAKHNGGVNRMDELQSCRTAHRSGWSNHRAALNRRIKGTPETDKRSKAKRHQNSIRAANFCGIQNVLPGLHPPAPVVRSVQHDHRAAAGSRRAMESGIGVDGKRQIASEPSRVVIVDELLLGRER